LALAAADPGHGGDGSSFFFLGLLNWINQLSEYVKVLIVLILRCDGFHQQELHHFNCLGFQLLLVRP
jgi:hypothetical protein